MRRCPRGIAEERAVLVVLDELERLVGNAGVGIVFPRVLARLLIGHVHAVANQVVGVIVVRVLLVVVTEEHIKALLLRHTGCACISQPPFAETTGRVTGIVQQAGHGRLISRKGEQADLTLVGAAQNVPRMLAGHQHAARRRTDGAAAVGLGKFYSFCGQTINVGRETILATIGREIADPRVVGEDEHNVGFLVRLRRRFSRWGYGRQQSEHCCEKSYVFLHEDNNSMFVRDDS